MAYGWTRWHAAAAPKAGEGVLARMPEQVRVLVGEITEKMQSIRAALAAAREAAAKQAASPSDGG